VPESDRKDEPLGDALLDSDFLSELEGLAATADRLKAPGHAAVARAELLAFLAPAPGTAQPLDEDAFVALPSALMTERTDALLEAARRSPQRDAGEAVDSFVVFFQALLPGLGPEASEQVRRLFFRLAPTLLHLCHAGFSGPPGDGISALSRLETILIEVSSVRLSPTEAALVARSIDQLAGFLAAGEYALATDVVSSQLLAILEKNRGARMLFRLMHIEASLQVYLQERLGYLTPRLRVPEDLRLLRAYGPLRVLDEPRPDGGARRLIQVQHPDVPQPRHVVLHLAPHGGGPAHDLRLDLLGCAELDVPPGAYDLGLVYSPPR
jgi:hypothetical protein